MSSLRRALIALIALAVLIGIGMLILILGSPDTHAGGVYTERGVYAVYTLAIGWAFAGTGLYAWARRPGNNVGPLMSAVGFAWLLQGLATSGDSVVFTIGALMRPLAFALLAHLLLAFPSGRLETLTQRSLAALVYIDVTVLQLASFVFDDTTASYANCKDCPSNPILISGSKSLYDVTNDLQALCALVVLVGLVVVLHRRWQGSAAGQRRALSPVLAAGALTLSFLVLGMLAGAFGADPVSEGAVVATLTALVLVPFAFLAGLLRSRLSKAEAVTSVVDALGEGAGRTALREALAEALGDPEVELAYWVPNRECTYVDSAGRPMQLDPAPREELGDSHRAR